MGKVTRWKVRSAEGLSLPLALQLPVPGTDQLSRPTPVPQCLLCAPMLFIPIGGVTLSPVAKLSVSHEPSEAPIHCGGLPLCLASPKCRLHRAQLMSCAPSWAFWSCPSVAAALWVATASPLDKDKDGDFPISLPLGSGSISALC